MSKHNINDSLELLSKLAAQIVESKSVQDVQNCFEHFNALTGFKITHVSIFKLLPKARERVLYTRSSIIQQKSPLSIKSISLHPFYELLAETLLPIDLASPDVPKKLRDYARKISDEADQNSAADDQSNRQIAIPMQASECTVLILIQIPIEEFSQCCTTILPMIYQTITSLLNRFPTLRKWPNEIILTRRESEILTITARGIAEPNIALRLGISVNTVRNHIENAKSKLGARNKLHAVSIAIRDGEINPIS